MFHRRELLKSALCGCGLAALARRASAIAVAIARAKRTRTVDLHAHAYIRDDWPLIRNRPEAAELEAFLEAPYLDKLVSVEARIAEMDREGVDVQAVSLYVGQYYYWAERDLSRDVVALQNQKLAEMCAARPDRLCGLGAVSLHHPDLAAEQVEQAMKIHGFPGFMVTGSVPGEEISARRFDPFWAKAEELDAIVFVHPRGFPSGAEGARRLQGAGSLGNTVGNPLETTVALSHMIFDGFLDRFPALRIVAAHGGGYLPSYIGRSDNCHAVDPNCRQMKRKPSEYLRQLYFDTLVYSPAVLRSLVDRVGADRIVMGTDYPFPVASLDPVGDVAAVSRLDDSEREAMLGATAARLLRLPRVHSSGSSPTPVERPSLTTSAATAPRTVSRPPQGALRSRDR
jgi:aminocarboxymuconate-semialdehyde decarboxylase